MPRASLIPDESARRRTAKSALGSLMVHAALLGIAVVASTTVAAQQAADRVRLTFFEPPAPAPTAPAAPSPAASEAPAPPPPRRVFVRKIAPPPLAPPAPPTPAPTAPPLEAPAPCTDPNGCNQNPGAAGGRAGGTGTGASGTGTGTGTGAGTGTGTGGPPRPMYLSPGMTRPRMVSGQQPQYTEQARRARVEGEVIARIEIGADGRVRDVTILRGLALLDQEVLRKVRGWRFTAPTYRGQPVSVYLIQRIGFRLED